MTRHECYGMTLAVPLRVIALGLLTLPTALAGDVQAAASNAESANAANRLARSMVPSTLPAGGTLEFPNGEPVSVQFRLSPVEDTGRPDLGKYPALRGSAEEGDVVAARTVGELMLYCGFMRRLPVSTEPPLAPFSLTKKPPPRTSVSEAKAAVLEFCDQRTPDEIASATRLLRLAAAGGDLQAILRLGELVSSTDESVRLFEDAWKRGTTIALSRLSKAYQRRSIASGPESGDAIQALAARWLYVKLNESAFRQHGVPSEFVEALNRDLDRKLEQASAGVRNAAVARARQMLSENAQCCSIP